MVRRLHPPPRASSGFRIKRFKRETMLVWEKHVDEQVQRYNQEKAVWTEPTEVSVTYSCRAGPGVRARLTLFSLANFLTSCRNSRLAKDSSSACWRSVWVTPHDLLQHRLPRSEAQREME